eukprot:scaffold210496_cov27-Prasinocladus_malaysianus.AAC.1
MPGLAGRRGSSGAAGPSRAGREASVRGSLHIPEHRKRRRRRPAWRLGAERCVGRARGGWRAQRPGGRRGCKSPRKAARPLRVGSSCLRRGVEWTLRPDFNKDEHNTLTLIVCMKITMNNR